MDLELIIEFLGGKGVFVYLCGLVVFYIFLDSITSTYRYCKKREPEIRRWFVNLSLYMLTSLISYSLLKWFNFTAESSASSFEFGLFNYLPNASVGLQLLAYFVLHDFFVYWLHRFSHAWRPIWRFHLIHHTDKDLDFSVSLRFHPLERMLDIPLVFLTTVLLGVDIWVFLVYNVVYGFYAFWPHSDIRVPDKLDKILKMVIVTPSMHRVHHSADKAQTNSNYADVFSFWDRMFGTYQHIPIAEQEELRLGLEYFRSDKEQGLISTLIQPFIYSPSPQKKTIARSDSNVTSSSQV
ncbi:MAG: sterol desaturase family protein [Piscirickettsiaceae bacterium]|nr:sterol desaturase family protein [Piscirickettsiaceae bacterium]